LYRSGLQTIDRGEKRREKRGQGEKGDRLLFLQERGQRLIADRKSEKVACPLFSQSEMLTLIGWKLLPNHLEFRVKIYSFFLLLLDF